MWSIFCTNLCSNLGYRERRASRESKEMLFSIRAGQYVPHPAFSRGAPIPHFVESEFQSFIEFAKSDPVWFHDVDMPAHYVSISTIESESSSRFFSTDTVVIPV